MPFIRLKRNWFGPNGVRYRKRDGMIQVDDVIADLAPSDAERFDDNGKELPSKGKEKLPGFGAKPLHELKLDQIPYAGPVHIQDTTVTSAPALEGDALVKHQQRAAEAEAALSHISEEKREEKKAEVEKAIQEGIDAVQEAEEAEDKTDPHKVAQAKQEAKPAPKPTEKK